MVDLEVGNWVFKNFLFSLAALVTCPGRWRLIANETWKVRIARPSRDQGCLQVVKEGEEGRSTSTSTSTSWLWRFNLSGTKTHHQVVKEGGGGDRKASTVKFRLFLIFVFPCALCLFLCPVFWKKTRNYTGGSKTYNSSWYLCKTWSTLFVYLFPTWSFCHCLVACGEDGFWGLCLSASSVEDFAVGLLTAPWLKIPHQ